MKNIAIFASGKGSNAAAICHYFQDHSSIQVALIVSNKEGADVLISADKYGIPRVVISKAQLNDADYLLPLLASYNVDFIALAGFLSLIPVYLIQQFPNKIVNIHPALLPQYGGAGMYGKAVHKSVYNNHEKETGMTVHLVNEQYDKGKVVLQKRVAITADDTPESIATKVQTLEHKYYAHTIETLIHLDLNRS